MREKALAPPPPPKPAEPLSVDVGDGERDAVGEAVSSALHLQTLREGDKEALQAL